MGRIPSPYPTGAAILTLESRRRAPHARGMDSGTTEREVWFGGKVQGVGFRYETLNVARGYAVTGFVENLPDGRVHLVAQGEPREVQSFVDAVADRLSDYIRETEQREQEAAVRETEFRIRR